MKINVTENEMKIEKTAKKLSKKIKDIYIIAVKVKTGIDPRKYKGKEVWLKDKNTYIKTINKKEVMEKRMRERVKKMKGKIKEEANTKGELEIKKNKIIIKYEIKGYLKVKKEVSIYKFKKDKQIESFCEKLRKYL